MSSLPEPSAGRSETIDLRSRPSYADAVAVAMIDQAHPPGLAGIRASIQALTSAQRAEMLLSPTLKPELRAMLEEAEATA